MGLLRDGYWPLAKPDFVCHRDAGNTALKFSNADLTNCGKFDETAESGRPKFQA
jgi:hypothetical protein